MAFKVNDTIGPHFATYEGVRQGDPLSPLLFDIVGDGLAMMMKKGKEEEIVTSLVSCLVVEECQFCSMQMALFCCWKINSPMPEMSNSSFVYLNRFQD
jgi:hypothetical protein